MKMSLQLYRVDQKNYLLDFMSLDSQDHPDAQRVKRMTRASMSAGSGETAGRLLAALSDVASLSVVKFVL